MEKAKTPSIKKPTVNIEKGQLGIMDRVERLEAAVSKARLQHFDDKRKKEIGKVVNLRVIDGKVIVGWSMIKDIVEKNQHGAWDEDQVIEITYEDGKKQKMPYVVFMRRYTLLPLEVKNETKDGEHTTFIGKTAEGVEYKILDTFVN